tara:strand:+ start:889 stop:1128 length:240 start_codon:yes stop_codon:yes gene_type:complete
MTNKREKLRAQVKSRFYYLFWGAATVSVFVGQIYVGSGYRRMADTNDAISADINLLVETLTESFIPRDESPYSNMPILQ